MNFVRARGMARPTIDIPEVTRLQVMRLRREGAKLKEISRKTGLKYHLVRRILAEDEEPPRVEIILDSDKIQRPPASAQSIFIDSKSWDEVPKEDIGFRKTPRKVPGPADDGRRLRVREGERYGHPWHDMAREARARREYELLMSPEYERYQKQRNEIDNLHLQTESIKAQQELLRLTLPKQPRKLYEFSYDRYYSLLLEETRKCIYRGLNLGQMVEYLYIVKPSIILDSMVPVS